MLRGNADPETAFFASFLRWNWVRQGNYLILRGHIINATSAPLVSVDFTIPQGLSWREALLELELETNAPPSALAQLHVGIYALEKGLPPEVAGFFMTRCLPKAGGRTRLSREQVRALADQILKTSLPALASKTMLQEKIGHLTRFDQVRLLMLLGREVWNPTILRQLPIFEPGKSVEDILYPGFLALCFPEFENITTLDVNGITVQLPARPSPERMLVFPQYLEWIIFHVPPSILQHIHKRTFPVWSPFEAYLLFNDDDLDVLKSTAATLIRIAESQKRYVPQGDFFLHLPENIQSLIGVDTLRLIVDPNGIWVVPYNPDKDRYGQSFRYNPHAPDHLSPAICGTGYREILDVILSALWHDLLTGGHSGLYPHPTPRPYRAVSPASHASTTRSQRAQTPVYSPLRRRTETITIEGWHAWGSDEERRIIQRRAHQVRGFLRRLPHGQRPSEQALDNALFYGLIVPDGYTFVRPHVRGRQAGDTNPVEIRTRGLATALITLTNLKPSIENPPTSALEGVQNASTALL
jgi:hypothetical protein